MWSYYASLHSEFRFVMSVTVSLKKRYSVRFCLQLSVGRHMSYLRYFCLFMYSGVLHILCCGFALFFFVLLPVSLYCIFFHCHFGILSRLFTNYSKETAPLLLLYIVLSESHVKWYCYRAVLKHGKLLFDG